MRRPALWSLLFLILGILLGRYGFGRVCTVLFGAGLICSALIYVKPKYTIMLLVFSVLGFILMNNAMNIGTDKLNEIADSKEKINIAGIVKDAEDTKSGYTKIDLKLLYAEDDDGNRLFSSDKNIHILIITEKVPVKINSYVKTEIDLEKFYGPENYGGFDSMVYNRARGFSYSGFCKDIDFSEGDKDFNFYIKAFRNKISEVYDRTLPEKESGILKALITGYRTGLLEETKNLYKASGIYHILAISGLHVSIFAGIIFYTLLKIIKLSRRSASLISIGIIVLYALFTGGSVPVIRASIMFAICMIGNVIGRYEDKINSLSLAGIIILLISPWFIFDAGFLLSFTATLGVFLGMIVMPEYVKGKSRIKTKILQSIIISAAVSGIILPVLIYFFGEISLYSILMNIVVSLFVPVILVLGIAAGIAGALFINAGIFLSGGIYCLLNLIELAAEFFSSLGFGIIVSERFSFLSYIIYYGWISSLMIGVRNNFKNSFYKYSAIVMAVMFFISVNSNRLIFKNDEIVFLNCGNGDSSVIKTYSGNVFIIDGGGNAYKNLGENTGKNVILPYLKSEGISEIDGIFISHMDYDHALGAIELLDLIKVNGVYIPDCKAKDAYIMQKLCEASERRNVNVYLINSGDKFILSDKSYIECLSPFEGNIISDSNRGSAVLKYVNGDFSVLYTGDIDFAAEEDLILKGIDLSAEVLKVSHHGSESSSSPEFIKAVGSKVSVISTGEDNIYGHPAEETIKRLSHTKIFITYKDGSIRFKTNGNGYKTEALRGET